MKFNINEIKSKVLVKYPYFGMITMNVNYRIVNSIYVPTACTDGKTIYFNQEFMDKLSEEEQVFVMAHEICHIAFNHIERAKDRIKSLWNYATDAVINAFLKRDGIPIISGMIDEADAFLYSAEEFYEKLLRENAQKPTSEEDLSHEIWTNEEMQKELGETSPDEEGIRRQKRVQKEQERIKNQDEKDVFEENAKRKKELLERMRQAIVEEGSRKEAGTDSVGSVRRVDDIGTQDRIIDWRYLLRESITYNLDFSYRNATIEDGVLTSHLEEIPHSEVEIVLDTSGSINEELLKCFLRECKNILQMAKVKVGCFDTKFYGFHEIRNFHDIDNMEYVGGGGTDFDVAVSAFSHRVINRIIFTDGWAAPPQNKLPVIWVIFGNREIKLPGSKVIYVDERELIKKYQKR